MKAVITLILLCVFASTAAAVEWSEYLLNRNADNAFSKGDFQQAYDQSAELIRENSDNGRYFHNLAESAMHLQRYDEAVDYYSQAVQLMDDKIKKS